MNLIEKKFQLSICQFFHFRDGLLFISILARRLPQFHRATGQSPESCRHHPYRDATVFLECSTRLSEERYIGLSRFQARDAAMQPAVLDCTVCFEKIVKSSPVCLGRNSHVTMAVGAFHCAFHSAEFGDNFTEK